MTDAARDRRELHQALADQLGDRPADTLMAHLPDRPTPDYATRSDLHANAIVLRGEMAELRAELRSEMSDLRVQLQGEMSDLRVQLQGEMADLRVQLQGEMADLRAELTSEMANLKVSLQRFVVTTILAGNTALAVLIITAFTVVTRAS